MLRLGFAIFVIELNDNTKAEFTRVVCFNTAQRSQQHVAVNRDQFNAARV